MSKAPERIWAEPGMPGYLDEPNRLYTVEYVRADRIEELEARLAKAMEVVEMIASADVDAVLGQAVDLSCEIIGELMELEAKLEKMVANAESTQTLIEGEENER